MSNQRVPDDFDNRHTKVIKTLEVRDTRVPEDPDEYSLLYGKFVLEKVLGIRECPRQIETQLSLSLKELWREGGRVPAVRGSLKTEQRLQSGKSGNKIFFSVL